MNETEQLSRMETEQKTENSGPIPEEALVRILALFHRDPASAEPELIDHSERGDDRRAAYIVWNGEQKAVLKIASNPFTTPGRIAGWRELIEQTRSLGVYSPALLPSVNGNIAEETEIGGTKAVVWEEEFAPYPLAAGREEDPEAYHKTDDARPRGKDGSMPAWQEELIGFYAKIGTANLPGDWGDSLYVRLTPPAGEKTDEVEECVLHYEKDLLARFPDLAGRWTSVRRRWEDIRRALAALYPNLPTSVFQADWNDSNVLLTGDGHFAGLIDYNLAGRDTVLNMAVSIGTYGFNASEGGVEAALKRTRRVLSLFAEHYRWTEEEIEAAPILWKYINALFWGDVEALKQASSPAEAEASLDEIENVLGMEPDFRGDMRPGRR